MSSVGGQEIPSDWRSLLGSDTDREVAFASLTKRYPNDQPETSMPNASATRAEPKTWPATVGINEKKPPDAAPLMIEKAIRGAKVVE